MKKVLSFGELLLRVSPSPINDRNSDEDIHSKGKREDYLAHAELTSKEIIQKFPKVKSVANTFRFDSDANELRYYTSLFTDGKSYQSQELSCEGVVDRSGSGDCFMAGLIYGFYNKNQPQAIIDYATSAAFGKLQEQGDATGQDVLTVKKGSVGND